MMYYYMNRKSTHQISMIEGAVAWLLIGLGINLMVLNNPTSTGLGLVLCIDSFAVLFPALMYLHNRHTRRSTPAAVAAPVPVRTRERIPLDVKSYIWQRDGGACVRCGSEEQLEFGHIIPWSKGGSDSEENLQILCLTCNRREGNRI